MSSSLISTAQQVTPIPPNSEGDTIPPRLSNAASLIRLHEGELVQAVTDIKEKLFVIILSVAILITFFFLLFDAPKHKFIGAQLFWVFAVFHIVILAHVFKCKYLHRIKIVTTHIAPDFGSIVFPLQIKPYPTKPITSISEMCAIRGSQLNHMFGFMCFMNTGILTAVLYSHLSNLNRFGNINSFWNKEYLEVFLSASTVVSLPLMGMFDLNPNDKVHSIVHYLGVLFMMVSVFQYALQSDFGGYSILLICGSFGCWLIWFCIFIYYPTDVKSEFGESEEGEHRMKEYVHSISVKCILSETIGCFFCCMATVAYVWNLRDVDQL
eukprot:223445_1